MSGIWFYRSLLILCLVIIGLSGCSIAGKEVKVPLPSEGMVYIPAGWFLMGSPEKDGRLEQAVGVDELPQHRVYLKAFYIDRYEVTVGDFKFFLKQTNRGAPRIWTNQDWVKLYPPSEDNHPMNGVTWYDADEYCRWKGKRLPTEAEWEKSARGSDGRQWPWGNEPDSMEQPRANTLDKGIGWTTPVGSYPAGVSPYGVHDMAGNVMEWTSSWYEAYPGSTLTREAFGQRYKVLKGGSWENPIVPYARSAYRHSVTPKWDHPGHGFRCALSMG